MKILFFARHLMYLRNFESALRLLAEQGHQVHIAASGREETFGGHDMVDRLCRDYPGITAGQAPLRTDDWFRLATRLRLGIDYLRYLDPAYASAPRIEARARERAPKLVVDVARWLANHPGLLARLAWTLSALEQAIPTSPDIEAYIREQAPDAVLITPLLGVVASPELDYLYASQALGLPTALSVWSWDHLSSKALIRRLPDRVLVWNPTQLREAVELHHVPRERVVVTGAQCFDHWFDRTPSRTRDAFCAHVGLPDSRPYLLWVCSALFKGSPPEAEYVLEWIRAVRASGDPVLRHANILIRPHPQRMPEWDAVDLSQCPGVAFWGGNPLDNDARADYFDSLSYSAAVAGLNTSAFIEGAIAGRPVYTVLPQKFYDNQEGTIHFHYLLDGPQALLRPSRDLADHVAQLADALRGQIPDPDRSRRFVESFVRPQGLGQASTPLFAEAVQSLPGTVDATPRRASGLFARLAVRGLRRLYETRRGRGWIEGHKPPNKAEASNRDKFRRARPVPPMKVLFLVRHYMYVRFFDSVIAELAKRGHSVHISADKWELTGGQRLVDRLTDLYPNVTAGWTPNREPGGWLDLNRRLKLGLDYLRFLDPRYAGTPVLRNRAAGRAPMIIRALVKIPGFSSAAGVRVLGRLLRFLERGVPRSPALDRFIRGQKPDVVLITPLVELGMPQLDHLLSARAARIPSVLCVGSWDHLSSKSVLRVAPDLVTVWNETQKDEAVTLHGLAAHRVEVTGAQCFDRWFEREPSRSRDSFLTRVGLPVDRPFLLYVCSSLFRGTASEPEFVEAWVQAIRGSADPQLRDMPILVRPHPQRLDEWQNVDLSGYRNVVFYGSHPIDQEAQNDYFDSLHFSHAVIGVNTSAFIEAAIAGRPVYTVLLPELSGSNQEGTLHFHYLLDPEHGLLHVARSFEEHLTQLGEAIRQPWALSEKSRRFVGTFVRPHGLESSATPRFVDAIEDAAAMPLVPRPSGKEPDPIAHAVLYPAYLVLTLRHRAVELVRYLTGKWLKDARRKVAKWPAETKRWILVRLGRIEARPAKTKSSALMPKIGRAPDPAKAELTTRMPEAHIAREEILQLGRSAEPVIVGPWLTETGFELLYWIPFLAWARAHGNLDPSQLFVVSRGGASSWYQGITSNYDDIFRHYTPEEFLRRNEERIAQQGGRLKHSNISPFDREIAARVAAERGLTKYRLLHPSLMYRLFNFYWRQLAPLSLIDHFTAYSSMHKVGLGELASQLPSEYVAVKFYANGALPDTPENRAFVGRVVQELSSTSDVVLLNTGVRFDDHSDYTTAVRSRVHTIEHLMTPETNLDIQTRVVAGAKAFVGTYGGFSYMGPFVGTNTVAFYSHPGGFRFDHLDVARRVFSGLGGGSFVPLDVKDVSVLNLARTSILGGREQGEPAPVVTP